METIHAVALAIHTSLPLQQPRKIGYHLRWYRQHQGSQPHRIPGSHKKIEPTNPLSTSRWCTHPCSEHLNGCYNVLMFFEEPFFVFALENVLSSYKEWKECILLMTVGLKIPCRYQVTKDNVKI